MEEEEMTPYKLGWKVVRIWKDGHLASAAGIGIFSENARLIYEFSKPTTPKDGCGPLSVFKKRKDAVDFLNIYRAVFPCAYIPSNKRYVWDGATRTPRGKLSKGKALASEVILLKERKS